MECYFFGTFNPLHLAHIKIADEIKKQFEFERVIFVPAYLPPHKKTLEFKYRLDMLNLALGAERVCDIESKLETPSYTYRTIQKLGKCHFIIGYDAFLEIESWKHPEILKEMLNFIVIPRKTSFDVKEFEILKSKGYTFKVADFKPLDISSKDIRKKVKTGISISGLVTKSTEEYIYEHRLYKNMA